MPAKSLKWFLDRRRLYDLVDELRYETGKVSFSYPVSGKKGSVAFWGASEFLPVKDGKSSESHTSSVYIFDRDRGEAFVVSRPSETGTPFTLIPRRRKMTQK